MNQRRGVSPATIVAADRIGGLWVGEYDLQPSGLTTPEPSRATQPPPR